MLLHRQRPKRYDAHILNIPDKANRILNVILIVLVLIAIRIWHLTVIQYEDKVEEARKPRVRVVVEPAKRATIRDRFNLPLAINKMRFQAAILYSQITEIPAAAWEIDENGKRVKKFKRREYITKLSKLLGGQLKMDPDRIEDLIHSKASFCPQIPYILKEDITESEYYRLKMLEKDWVGIQVLRIPRRHYPQGRVGADIIGYMGAINRNQYDNIIHEIKTLEQFLKDQEAGELVDLPEDMSSTMDVRQRLKELQERAYTINDYVGKTGIEKMFEEELRGFHGRKNYYSDARGNFLRELPSAREPLPGHRLLLTISSELQEYAEQLLAQNEEIREGRLSSKDFGKAPPPLKQPWIKGGSIVAMDPNSGEVLALVSHPRFDPNDFIMSGNQSADKTKQSRILQWFENESYLAEVWDQKRPLTRELFDDKSHAFYEDERVLSWENYLDFILPKDSPVARVMQQIGDVRRAVELQRDFQLLLEVSGQTSAYHAINRLYRDDEGHETHHNRLSADEREELDIHFTMHAGIIANIKKRFQPYFGELKNNYDKILVLDLCRLSTCSERFSDELLIKVGKQSLSAYRDASAATIMITDSLRRKAKDLFHEWSFKQWRKEHEKEYLKEKRKEEKLVKRYPKPYIDYIDAKENEMFQEFWKNNFWQLMTFFLKGQVDSDAIQEELRPYVNAFVKWQEEIFLGADGLHSQYIVLKKSLDGLDANRAVEYLQTMRSFRELDRTLLGRYLHLRKELGVQKEKHLASAFYPVYGFGYGRSQAYRQAAIQGSIFKLVTAYTALKQRYLELKEKGESLSKLNPYEMTDDAHRVGKTWYVGFQANGTVIPQLYKGGRLPRSRVQNMGKVDMARALEISSNAYFSLLAGDYIQEPNDLIHAARDFSYGSRTGIDLPAELAGKVPLDTNENRTGLYSLAIGQHSLVVTPLQTAVMLSSIANGGKIYKPKIVRLTAGRERRTGRDRISSKNDYFYKDNLALIGIDFPLFSAMESREQESLINQISPELKREIFMPAEVRDMILQAMRKVTIRCQTEGLSGLIRMYKKNSEALKAYQELRDELLGKTSTSEALENVNLDLKDGTGMCKHVWFGGISFEQHTNKNGTTTFTSKDAFGRPELVVVVYLRYGAFGKEAAPLAALVVKKWREIRSKYEQGSVALNN